MAERLLKVTLSRVDKALFDGEVIAVSVPGVGGHLQILAHHEPLISPLTKGVVTLHKENGETESFMIESGTLEISDNHATILV